MKLLFTIGFCALYAALNVSGAALIKSELKLVSLNHFMDFFHFLLRLKVLAGFSVIFVSALVMFKALDMGNLSFVIPVATGINFLLTIAIGVMLFKDKISVMQYVGLAIILTGIVLISVAKPDDTPDEATNLKQNHPSAITGEKASQI